MLDIRRGRIDESKFYPLNSIFFLSWLLSRLVEGAHLIWVEQGLFENAGSWRNILRHHLIFEMIPNWARNWDTNRSVQSAHGAWPWPEFSKPYMHNQILINRKMNLWTWKPEYLQPWDVHLGLASSCRLLRPERRRRWYHNHQEACHHWWHSTPYPNSCSVHVRNTRVFTKS
jgi:hypothetical protein